MNDMGESERRLIRASVIIAALNAAKTITEQLDALASQSFDGEWEVIVADNGSADETRELALQRRTHLPNLRVVDASARKGAGAARNIGAEFASGEILCFCDADDVVSDTWLEALLAGANKSDIVAGRLDLDKLNDSSVRMWSPAPRASRVDQVQEWAPSSNMAIRAELFRLLGGFDENYLKAQDVELSRRARADGHDVAFCSDAVVHYRLRTTLGGVLKQGYRTGRGQAQACGDGAYSRRPYAQTVRSWLWLLTRLPTVATSARRGLWVRRAGEAAGRLVGSFRYRVLYL